MCKKDIRNLSYSQLLVYLENINEQTFRAGQIFEWMYKKGAKDFAGMTNLSSSLRNKLQNDFSFPLPNISQQKISSDNTKKFLLELNDKQKIETVFIPTARRVTVCVSTQAGCKFGCRFCASGVGGWKRNLTCAEILSQILYAKEEALRFIEERAKERNPLSHIVFMGTGEPLDNYDELFKAIRIVNAREGMHIAARRITVSTCGLIPGIEKLAKEGLQIELAVSLHGYNNESRNMLMPVNKKYPLPDLITACRKYIAATKRQITFEYVLIKDITCSAEAVQALGKLLKGMICKINLIPYNEVDRSHPEIPILNEKERANGMTRPQEKNARRRSNTTSRTFLSENAGSPLRSRSQLNRDFGMASEFNYKSPSKKEALAFKEGLNGQGIHSTIRMPRGQDVGAACGQLRNHTV